jgi:hypothetical protein
VLVNKNIKVIFKEELFRMLAATKSFFVYHNEAEQTRPVLDRFHDSSKVNAQAVCFMLYAL